MNSIQDDFLKALALLAPEGITPRRKEWFANTGVIYYQDANWQTVLGVSYDFQDHRAQFNITEVPDAVRKGLGLHQGATCPQGMTWWCWLADYAKGGLGLVEAVVRTLLSRLTATAPQSALPSGGWNYRMFHRQVPDGLGDVEDEYTIREAYYDQNGNVNAWSEQPSAPHGESRMDLMDDVSLMSRAIAQPVVEITPDGNALAQTDGTERS